MRAGRFFRAEVGSLAAAVWLALAGPASALGDAWRQDLRNLATYQHLGLAAAGLGLAGIAHQWDADVRDEFGGMPVVESTADITNVFGASSFNMPVSLGMWAAGRLTGREGLERMGSVFVRTLGLAQVVVAPLKLSVRRLRPDGSNRLSFPSGHTANSFALARVVHRHYGAWVGVPLYVFSGFVAAGRIEDDRHFLSDVVMGAALGLVVGNAVTLEGEGRFEVAPALSGSAGLLVLRVRF